MHTLFQHIIWTQLTNSRIDNTCWIRECELLGLVQPRQQDLGDLRPVRVPWPA
jgi:hypothetical protein